MIAYDKRGRVFALTEGAELLLHDGESEGPLWRTTLDARIVGLGIDSEQVVAVTEAGSVTTFTAHTGERRGSDHFAGRVLRACVDVAADRIVAITDTAIVEAGAMKTLADHSANAIALAPSGAVLVATDTELVAFAPDRTRTSQPLAGVRALAYHPEGFWVIGLAGKVMRWNGAGEPTHITNLPPGSKLEHIACSDRALAIAWDRHMVAALEWPAKETLGSLQYIERTVDGLDFGPWPWLGVALDLGDGNKFQLETASLNRSDTHPGRQHHSWLVSVGGSSKPSPSRAAPSRAAPTPASSPSGARSFAVLLALAALALVIFFAMR